MSVEQFGQYYFDPADIVAINTKPLRPHSRDQESDYYFVYLRHLNRSLMLVGDAARKCFAAFINKSKNARKRKGISKKETKK